jgi:hypothetical protein
VRSAPQAFDERAGSGQTNIEAGSSPRSQQMCVELPVERRDLQVDVDQLLDSGKSPKHPFIQRPLVGGAVELDDCGDDALGRNRGELLDFFHDVLPREMLRTMP